MLTMFQSGTTMAREMNQVIQILAQELGINPGTIRTWQRRGAVPYWARPRILEAAKAKRIRLSEADLEWKRRKGLPYQRN